MARYPRIHLLTFREADLEVFRSALNSSPLPEAFEFSYHTGSLRDLDNSVHFDAVVSPANSYGRMDGGFDDALSMAFSPEGDYLALTHVVQRRLYQEWRGYAPPGTCTLVPFDFANIRGCRMIALCPTMKIPQPIPWEREVIYECMWSLLCAITRWNETCNAADEVHSLLMTPLATGAGGLSAERWAAQIILAMKHFHEACTNEIKWSKLEVHEILDLSTEVEATHHL